MNVRATEKKLAKVKTVFNKLETLSRSENDDRLIRAKDLVGEYIQDVDYEMEQWKKQNKK